MTVEPFEILHFLSTYDMLVDSPGMSMLELTTRLYSQKNRREVVTASFESSFVRMLAMPLHLL